MEHYTLPCVTLKCVSKRDVILPGFCGRCVLPTQWHWVRPRDFLWLMESGKGHYATRSLKCAVVLWLGHLCFHHLPWKQHTQVWPLVPEWQPHGTNLNQPTKSIEAQESPANQTQPANPLGSRQSLLLKAIRFGEVFVMQRYCCKTLKVFSCTALHLLEKLLQHFLH